MAGVGFVGIVADAFIVETRDRWKVYFSHHSNIHLKLETPELRLHILLPLRNQTTRVPKNNNNDNDNNNDNNDIDTTTNNNDSNNDNNNTINYYYNCYYYMPQN